MCEEEGGENRDAPFAVRAPNAIPSAHSIRLSTTLSPTKPFSFPSSNTSFALVANANPLPGSSKYLQHNLVPNPIVTTNSLSESISTPSSPSSFPPSVLARNLRTFRATCAASVSRALSKRST